MVDKVKQLSRSTAHKVQVAYDVVAMAASVAAATKVAMLPKVTTAFGQFPAWQLVAAVLFAGVAFHIYKLKVTE